MKANKVQKTRSPEPNSTLATRSPQRANIKPKKPPVQVSPQTVSNVNLQMNFFNVNSKAARGVSTEKQVAKQTEKKPRTSTAGALSVSRSDAFLQRATQSGNPLFSKSQDKTDLVKVKRTSQKISEPKFLRSKAELSATNSINLGSLISTPQELASCFASFAKKEAKKWSRVEDILIALKASLPSNQKQISTVLEQLAMSSKRAKKGAKKMTLRAEKASEVFKQEPTIVEQNRDSVEEAEFFKTELRYEVPTKTFSKKEEPAAEQIDPPSPPRKKRQTVFNLAKQSQPSPPPVPPKDIKPALPDPRINLSGLSARSARISNEQWKTPRRLNPSVLSQLLDVKNGSVSMRDSRRNLSEVSRHHYSMLSHNLSIREQDALPLSTSAIFQPESVFDNRSTVEMRLDSAVKSFVEKHTVLTPTPQELSAIKPRKSEITPEKSFSAPNLPCISDESKSANIETISRLVETFLFDEIASDPLTFKIIRPLKTEPLNTILIQDDCGINDSCEVAYAIRTHHLAIREYLVLLQRPFIDLLPLISQDNFYEKSSASFEIHEKQLMVNSSGSFRKQPWTQGTYFNPKSIPQSYMGCHDRTSSQTKG